VSVLGRGQQVRAGAQALRPGRTWEACGGIADVSMGTRRLAWREIERLRAHRWRTAPERQIGSERGALRLISELGFVLLMPMAGIEFPSIHKATRKAWAWWDWKQTLPGRKACYYAKVLRRRGTLISWEWFPCFYAAYADDTPYWRQYRDGLLGRSEKQILDLLASSGPLMTREVRLAFGPRSKENTRRVKSILVELQTRFLVAAAGGDTKGWSHHRWDLVERWVARGVLNEAAGMGREEARKRIVRRLVENLLATTAADIAWVLGWRRGEVEAIVAGLLAEGSIETVPVAKLEGEVLVPKPWPAKGVVGGGSARRE